MEQQPLLPEIVASSPPNNGNGRPRGAKNLKHRALERAARSESLPIVLKLCQMARDGDVLAARVILDRVWPRPRSAPFSVELPPTRTPAEVRAAMHSLLDRVSSGEIAPDDGMALVSMMRDTLQAHNIQTMSPVTINVDARSADARQVLAERLSKVVEQRRAPDDAD